MGRRWSLVLVAAATLGALQTANAGAAGSARPKTDYAAADGVAIADPHLRADIAIAGQTLRNSAAAPKLKVANRAPSAIGQWSAPYTPPGSVIAIHAVMMHTGKVLMWTMHQVPGDGSGYEEQAIAAVYDPVTKISKRVDPPLDMNIFCGAATILQDGRVLVVGGLDPYNGYSGEGIPVVLTFDPVTLTWTVLPPMRHGRWYPSVITLADGSALVVGGHAEGVRNAPNNDLEHILADGSAPQVVNQYPVGAGEDMYSPEFQLPDGRVFSFVSKRSDWIDPSTWRISSGPAVLAKQYTYPNGVLLPLTPGGHFVVSLTGGRIGPQTSNPGTTTSVRIDLSVPSPKFTAMSPLLQPRTNSNTVLLPDGTMLMVGGNLTGNFLDPYYQATLYNLATDVWTPVASQTRRRAYHSTALLLPDATVLSAGDNGGGVIGGANSVEVYSPPYLFKGPRPVITSLVASAAQGSALTIGTDSAVTRAVLIAPGAATHATDIVQREIVLPVVLNPTSGITASIPADGTVPSGYYMMFVLNSSGVPSVAQWIHVG
jgi:hypothetical protein